MTRAEMTEALDQAKKAESRGEYETTKSCAELVLTHTTVASEPLLHAEALRLLGAAKTKLGNSQEALEHLLSSVELFTHHNDVRGKARSLLTIGVVYQDLYDFPRSIQSNLDSLTLYELLGSDEGMASCLSNCGSVYLLLKDYSRATEYFHKAYELFEKVNGKLGMAITLANLGSVYRIVGDKNDAIEYFHRSLALSKDLGATEILAANYTNIGITYKLLKDFSKALEFYYLGLGLYENSGMRLGCATIRGLIGNTYYHEEFVGYDLDKAEEYLREAISISEEIGAKINLYEFHESLATVCERQERWKDFAFHFRTYHELEREVQSDNAKKQAERLDYERKQAEREKQTAVTQAVVDARHNATQSLLHKVLPGSIATRMIDGESEIADFFPHVSILFADIVGFTPLTANMPATVVVRFLNYVFSEFDSIMKKHGCEKIKTIGDGYMAVAGAPVECDDHAERIVAAAFEMQEVIRLPQDIRDVLPPNSSFGIRIGLHEGSVVAGVVGTDRFVYDIYSDAVNTAARMESHGEANKIHISSDFHRHLIHRFAKTKNTTHGMIFEERGVMEVKGKGKMRTYFVTNTR